MFTRNLFFRFYTSSTAGEVPTLLPNYFGRVWLNTADGIIYTSKYVDNVLTLVSTPVKPIIGTPVNAIAARGTFEITGANPILIAGKVLRIDNKAYGIVAALTGIEVEGEVLIGANDAATIANLVLALAGDAGTHGVNHWCTVHPTVKTASSSATKLIVEAKVAGAAGNLIPITTTIAAGAAWDAATLGTTVLGVNGTPGTKGDSYVSADLTKTWIATVSDTGYGATWGRKTSPEQQIYGGMYMEDATVATTITTAHLYYPISSGFLTGLVNGVTFQNAKELKVLTAGIYRVDWSASISVNASDQTIEGLILAGAAGTTEQVQTGNATRAKESGVVYSVSGCGFIQCSVNDLVRLGLENETSAGKIITCNHATVTLNLIKGL